MTDAVDIYTFLDEEGLRRFGDDFRQVVDEFPMLGRVLTRLMQELAVADAEAETVWTRTNRTERRVYDHCIELEQLRARSDGRP